MTLQPTLSINDHRIGPADAPVVLLEYGDFQCPFSARAHRIVNAMLAHFGLSMRFVFRNFPLTDIHPDALQAAEAAESVAVHDGAEAYWVMHALLFTHQQDSYRPSTEESFMRSLRFSSLVLASGLLPFGTLVVIALGGPALADGRVASPRDRVVIPAAVAGKTITVKMLGDAKGMRFEPGSVTVSNGDAIRFVNLSGGPHNVAFDPARIPAAAKTSLSAALPNQLSNMMGPMVTTPNGTYVMTIAKVPAGRYDYFCTPHLSMGMKGVITVK